MSGTLDRLITAALTANGSGRLVFDAMLQLLEAGRERALTVSTVDATSDAGWTPRPECGFHIETAQLERDAPDPVARAEAAYRQAVACYAGKAAKLDGVEFEVWFWNV
jgi:hypothetical protein